MTSIFNNEIRKAWNRLRAVAEGDSELNPTWLICFALFWSASPIMASGINTISGIKLILQDSSGYTEKYLRKKEFSKNMVEILNILDTGKSYIQGSDTNSRLEYMSGGCGCKSPSDTLEIMNADKSVQVYQFFCSSTKRISNASSSYLSLSKKSEKYLSNRWDYIRSKYCKGSYGCGDSEQSWHWYLEKKTDSGWAYEEFHLTKLPYIFIRNIKENKISQPIVEMAFTIHVGDERVNKVEIDSIDNKFKLIVKSFVKEATGAVYLWRKKAKVEKLKLTAYNFHFEN